MAIGSTGSFCLVCTVGPVDSTASIRLVGSVGSTVSTGLDVLVV